MIQGWLGGEWCQAGGSQQKASSQHAYLHEMSWCVLLRNKN